MSSAAQIEANRLNAQKSTGPKSEEGKAASARNATKHGFYSAAFVIADEEREAFDGLRDRVLEDHPLSDSVCEGHFTQILHSSWNLQRLYRLENRIYATSPNPFADAETLRQLDALRRHKGHFERSLRAARKDYAAHITNVVSRTTLVDALREGTPPTADTRSFYDVCLRKRTLIEPSDAQIRQRNAEIRAQEADISRIKRKNEEISAKTDAFVQRFIRGVETPRRDAQTAAPGGEKDESAAAAPRKPASSKRATKLLFPRKKRRAR